MKFFKFAFCLLLLAVLSLGLATKTYAKSYSIISDTFEIEVNQDKSISVAERLTYDFDGSFSWAEMWIPTQVARQGNTYVTSVSDFSISATDGSSIQLLATQQETDRFYAKWGYSAQDEQKTFVIKLRCRKRGAQISGGR